MSKSFRKLDINGDEYKWKTAIDGVKIRKPDGSGEFIRMAEIIGNEAALQLSLHGRESGVAVKPGDVANYIRENMTEKSS